jgi:hypothetical protein
MSDGPEPEGFSAMAIPSPHSLSESRNAAPGHRPSATALGGRQEAAEARLGADLALTAPVAELRDVHAAVPYFAVMHPGLRFLQTISQGPLGVSRFLPELAEQPRKGEVAVLPL